MTPERRRQIEQEARAPIIAGIAHLQAQRRGAMLRDLLIELRTVERQRDRERDNTDRFRVLYEEAKLEVDNLKARR